MAREKRFTLTTISIATMILSRVFCGKNVFIRGFTSTTTFYSRASLKPTPMVLRSISSYDYPRFPLNWKQRFLHHNYHQRIHSSSSLLMTNFSEGQLHQNEPKDKRRIPVTLLAGFLGSGKTSALENLLTNNDGVKIGIIVNDVASVNIDEKLINNPLNNGIGGEYTMELQNGCVCCSLAEEFLTSVEQLTLGGTRELDSIVVELSGISDPIAVKDNWVSAAGLDHPVTKYAHIENIVTLVDSITFGTDWMSWDTPLDRDGWVDSEEEAMAERNIPELLAEQVEAADVLLINKVDLADKEQVKTASSVARNLNEKAELFEVEYGKISVSKILGSDATVNDNMKGGGKNDIDAPNSHSLDDTKASDTEPSETSHSHSHDHATASDSDSSRTSNSHSHDHTTASDSDSSAASHSHSHSHDHTTDLASESSATSHSHSHDHATDSDSTSGGASHSHDHDHDSSSLGTDPDCTDTSHSHDHDHATSINNLGISNFVYKANKPFNTGRLMTMLNSWPVPIKDHLVLDELSTTEESATVDYPTANLNSPFVGVLRSKGFCWLAPNNWNGQGEDKWRHDVTMFWSHAGKHFGINTAGRWWDTLSKEQMKGYFTTNMKEYERILEEDWISEEWGDRRQELVFIGVKIDEIKIREALDACLCTEDEMTSYRQQLKQFADTTRNTISADVPPS